MLETVLVLPLLLWITFGCIEYGYYMYVKHTLQGASREAARTAIVPSATTAEVTSAVAMVMSSAGFGDKGYTVSIESPPGTPTNLSSLSDGAPIAVKVSVPWGNFNVRPFSTMAPGGIGLAAGKPVIATTVMRKE